MNPTPHPTRHRPRRPRQRREGPGLALADTAQDPGAGQRPGHDRQRRWDVGAHDGDIVAMPLLARAAAEHRGALTGVGVLYINHAISDSLMVARALTAIGAELVNVLIPYRGRREDNHASLRLAFEALGPSGSALKTAHEGAFVAQALVDECAWLLRRDHQFLRHRNTVSGPGARRCPSLEDVGDPVPDAGLEFLVNWTTLPSRSPLCSGHAGLRRGP